MRTPIPVAISLLGLAPVSGAQAWLDAPQRLPAVGGVGSAYEKTARASGDLDLDGDLDLLAVCATYSLPSCGELQSLLNDGGGTFTAGPITALGVAVPSYLVEAALGDVTGDGRADAVLAFVDAAFFGTSHRYVVHPGLPGGAFAPAIAWPATGIPRDLALGDSDGDGVLDVLTLATAGGSELRWWRFNGSSFASSAVFTLPFGDGLLQWIDAADLDGDGDADYAGGGFLSGLAHVGKTVGGAPQLGVSFSVLADAEVLPRAADLDQDGDVDVLLASPNLKDLQFTRLLNDGAGNFAPATPQVLEDVLDPAGYDLALGDWDGDGDPDAAVQTADDVGGSAPPSVRFFENRGSGGYELKGSAPTDSGMPVVGFADWNSDGHGDYVSGLHAIWGNDLFRSSLAPIDTVSLAAPPGLAYDLEGDGDLDLPSGYETLWVNDGTASFAPVLDLFPPATPPGTAFNDADGAGVADFDGDGRLDWLLPHLQPVLPYGSIFLEMRLLADNGYGQYVDAGPATPIGVQMPQFDPEAMPLPVADLDADGDLDVLSAGGHWLNGGSGFFAGFTPAFAGVPAAAGDVDADGDVDLLSVEAATSTLWLQRSSGGPSYAAESLLVAPNLHTRAFLLDLDDDGDPDAALGSTLTGDRLHLFSNDGASLAHALDLATGSFAGHMVLADDLDGDGRTDLTTTWFSQPFGSPELVPLLVYRRVGPGLAYEPAREYLGRPSWIAADLDGDGDRDLAGNSVIASWRHTGADVGSSQQYGHGSAGSGGAVPLLGASGPFQVGSSTNALHLRRSFGPSFSFLDVALAPTALVDFPFPGMPLWIDLFGGAAKLTLPVTGAGAGQGGWNVPIHVDASFAGHSFYLQAWAFDPGAPFLFTTTNGLHVHYGP